MSRSDDPVPAGPSEPTRRRIGLRSAVTLSFAGGALGLSAVLAVGTYLVARDYLVDQRERVAVGAGFADASYIRAGLLTESKPVSDVLEEVSPPADGTVIVRLGDDWYGTSLAVTSDVVPAQLREVVANGGAGVGWTTVDGSPAVVLGVALPGVDAEFYEVAESVELDGTLQAISVVLFGFALLTTVAGALLGRWAARRALSPLHAVASTTGRIAGGDLGSRLESTGDPDLAVITDSFNQMVDALQERIDRDTRFTADVSHELRSPLTTLMTSVRVLEGRRDELSPTSRDALHLTVAELERFRAVLDDLLELGRLDAGAGDPDGSVVDARELVRQALAASGRSPDLLLGDDDSPVLVEVDKRRMSRALINMFANADLHGGGLVGVRVRAAGSSVLIHVDDAGPGVPVAERERVFERFVRGGSRRSLPGAGLGLSLVAETVRAHGGTVTCGESPVGGARFSVLLPAARSLVGVDR